MLIPSRAWDFIRAGRNGQFGVRVGEMATGGEYDNPLLNDVDVGDEADGTEFVAVFEEQPTSGTLTHWTDGSTALVDAADGAYELGYQLYTFTPGDGAAQDRGTAEFIVSVGEGASAPVGLATESDAAFSLPAVQIRAVGLAVETDTALALDAEVAGGAGIAAEVDVALALPAMQVRVVGLAVEADTAFALDAASGLPVGMALEINTSFALTPVQRRGAGLAVEVDMAFSLGGPGDLDDLYPLAGLSQGFPLAGQQQTFPLG